MLFALATVQTVLLAGLVFAFHPLEEPLSGYLEVLALLLLTSFVSVGMGLGVLRRLRGEGCRRTGGLPRRSCSSWR